MGGPKDERGQRQELDDLNNERAGNETGRIRRFLHDRDPEVLEAKKREDERKLSALMRLLEDPAYRAAFDGAWAAYERAQSTVDDALNESVEAVERLTDYVEKMDARAHRLGDEAVFQDASGRFFWADGSPLSDEETSRVERSADAPSFEARRQAGDALEAAQARRAHILEIQATVLDPVRARLQDEDNPMSQSELEAVTRDLDGVTEQVQDRSMRNHFGQSATPPTITPEVAETVDDLVLDPIEPLR